MTLLIFFFSNKTVPDGAIAFYVGHCVTARVSKFTYGVKSARQFFPWIPDHMRRQKDVSLSLAGHFVIDGYFSTILRKVRDQLQPFVNIEGDLNDFHPLGYQSIGDPGVQGDFFQACP